MIYGENILDDIKVDVNEYFIEYRAMLRNILYAIQGGGRNIFYDFMIYFQLINLITSWFCI